MRHEQLQRMDLDIKKVSEIQWTGFWIDCRDIPGVVAALPSGMKPWIFYPTF
jgi:hypothetical protein